MSKQPVFPRDLERNTWHIIFTTYGSRLQGSERGSHRHGTGSVKASKPLEDYHQRLMKDETVVFHNQAIRDVVHNSIMKTCVERDWSVSALNVRTNHVHILMTTLANENTSYVVGALKSGAVEALAIFPEYQNRKIWTEKSSVNPVVSARYFQYALRYVMEQ